MKKRLLSILLAFCMLTGLFPSQAIAIGEVSSFADVKPTDWYYEGIEYVRKNNLMNGAGEGTFLPNEPMSRAMTATALHRLAGSPAPTKAAEFSDVPEGQWYSQAVAWAAERQIVSGYGDGRFGSAHPVTRQQLAAILYRYAQQSDRTGLEKTADLSAFSDQGQIGEYALAPMQWAVGSGLLTGTSSTTLDPNGLATRGQIATILARFCQEATPAEKFTITFDLNYGENPVYQTQQVESGKTASKPANPTRSGYAFAGWHTKKEGGAPYDFAAPITSDLTLYALWNQAASGGIGGGGGFGGGGSSSDGSGSGNSESPYIYSITGVAMAEGTPQITVNTDKACVLQVRLLDDEGKNTLDTVTTQASAQLELEKIPVPLNVTPPEYFRLEASLLDENGKELCDKFLCVNYTSAYAAFAAATVDDFKGQIVLNFDEQPDKNFGVLPEGAIQAQAAPTSRAGGNVVVLDNADHRLDETKIGTIIAVHNAQDEVEDLIKVRKITFSEDQAIIEPDPDAALEDFYDLLKVDMTVDADESMVDMSEADEGVALIPSGEKPQGRIDETFQKTLEYTLKEDLGGATLTGSAKGSASLNFAIEWSIFNQYFYSKVSAATDLTITAGIDGHFGGSGALDMGSIRFVTNIPGLTVDVELELPYSWSLDGAASVTTTAFAEYGAAYGSDSGAQLIQKHNIDSTVDIKVEGNASIGIRPVASVAYFHTVIAASIAPEAGLIATASFEKHSQLRAEEAVVHACSICVDGTLDAYGKLNIKFSYRITDKWKGTPLDKDLAQWRNTITPFYLSVSNEADSPLEGQVKFGFGECPNQKYRTEFAVQNSEGQNVSDAQLTVSKGGLSIPDTAPGKAVYLYNGDYTAAAQAGDQQGTKDFKVNGKAQTVTVQLGKGTDEPDNPYLTKLAAPTNLTWGKDSKGNSRPGTFYWEQNCDNFNRDHGHRFQLRLYKEDGTEIFSTRHSRDYGHSSIAFTTYSVHVIDIEKSGNGIYYFTVQELGDGKTTVDSDISTSGKWTYTVPNKQLEQVRSAPKIENEQIIWNALSDETNVYGYIIEREFYLTSDRSGKCYSGGLHTVTGNLSNVPIESWDWKPHINKEGYWFLRVKAIPKDMTQYRSSEWSEFSEPYHYIP